MNTFTFESTGRRMLAGSALAALLPAVPLVATAQTPPDAGRILQQQTPAPDAPRAAPGVTIDLPKSTTAPTGGPRVAIQSLVFAGNTLFASDVLAGVIGNLQGQTFDLAGLRALADRITNYYREAGYPFVRCIVPQQRLTDGVLRLQVIEGRYGRVQPTGAAELVAPAAHYLARLQPGTIIESGTLERTTLLLNDLPGINVIPTLQPGTEIGTGDLTVAIERTARAQGQVSLDNFGNRYTGKTQLRADLDLNSPLRFGDQLSLKALTTQGSTWYGSVGYAAPLGHDGLRAQLSYAKTSYQLGGEFAKLGAQGSADIASAGLVYPIVFTQQTDVRVSATLQQKELNDAQKATATTSDKASTATALALRFSRRDAQQGAGITFGFVAVTQGRLRLDALQLGQDVTGARTDGQFGKVNADLARLQALTGPWTLYGRIAGQWANKNLDSSEKFGLGGANGVRAYPAGEGFGDRGWLGQIELRYAQGDMTPYAFYDAGAVRTNVKPWTTDPNRRTIAGAGVGVRYSARGWRLDAALAWKTRGGEAQSDQSGHGANLWLGAQFGF